MPDGRVEGEHPSGVVVRPYAPDDRPAVRTLCHRVGYMGESAAWYWRHAESFADIWTSYYTDREPESFFVAVRDGTLIGYLAGCVDSRNAPTPTAAVTRAAIRYQLFFRPGTARFLWRGIRDSLREGGGHEGDLRDPRWPAHLHIDILPEGRECGVGRALMTAWFTRLSRAAVRGCHLGTLLENVRALRFFEAVGFRRHGAPVLVPGMRQPSGGRHHVQLMVAEVPAV